MLVIFCLSFQIYFLPCPGRVNYPGITWPMISICVQPTEGIDKRSKGNRKKKLISIFSILPSFPANHSFSLEASSHKWSFCSPIVSLSGPRAQWSLLLWARGCSVILTISLTRNCVSLSNVFILQRLKCIIYFLMGTWFILI